MGELLVKCERCGGLYPSGIMAELENVKRKLKELNSTLTVCPFCRHENLIDSAKLIIAQAY